jgi:hypothetical protein
VICTAIGAVWPLSTAHAAATGFEYLCLTTETSFTPPESLDCGGGLATVVGCVIPATPPTSITQYGVKMICCEDATFSEPGGFYLNGAGGIPCGIHFGQGSPPVPATLICTGNGKLSHFKCLVRKVYGSSTLN